MEKNSWRKTHASITVTVVRDRKIRNMLRTNQIVGFIIVPTWKKKKSQYLAQTHAIILLSIISRFPFENLGVAPVLL